MKRTATLDPLSASMHPSNSEAACSHMSGSAALVVCGAASALLKLQAEARAGERRQLTTGSKCKLQAAPVCKCIICRARHLAGQPCCSSTVAPIPASNAGRPTIIAARFQSMDGTPTPAQLKLNLANVAWQRLHPNGQGSHRSQPRINLAV